MVQVKTESAGSYWVAFKKQGRGKDILKSNEEREANIENNSLGTHTYSNDKKKWISQYKNALGVKSSKTKRNRLIKSIIPLSNQCSRNQQKCKTRIKNIKKNQPF